MPMYPNSSGQVSGGGAADWKTNLPETLKNKAPDCANGYRRATIDGQEVIIFTKDGADVAGATRYKAGDGSVFTGSSSSSASASVGNGAGSPSSSAVTQGPISFDGSVFTTGSTSGSSSGSSSIYGDLGVNFSSAGYDINPNQLMASAGMMYDLTNLAGSTPFSLGGLFSQGAFASVMQGFMNAVSFNFDFSNADFRAKAPTVVSTSTSTSTSTGDQASVSADGNATVSEGAATVTQTAEQVRAQAEAQAAKKGHVPAGWSHAKTDNPFEADYTPVQRAPSYPHSLITVSCTEVAYKLMDKYNIDNELLTREEKELLIKGLEAANPSVFDNIGRVKTGVTDWSKLDYPGSKELILAACGVTEEVLAQREANNPAITYDTYAEYIEHSREEGVPVTDVANKDGTHTVTNATTGDVNYYNKDGRLIKTVNGDKTTEYKYKDTTSNKAIEEILTTPDYVQTTSHGISVKDVAIYTEETYITDLKAKGINEITYEGPNQISYTIDKMKTVITFAEDGSFCSEQNFDVSGDTPVLKNSETHKNGYVTYVIRTAK